MNAPALQLRGLSRSFGRTTVLTGVDLSLTAGERLAVVGSSGSGKTTLLRLIAGLDVPTCGGIDIAGRPVSRSDQLLLPPEQRSVAMVFQGLALFPHLRTLDQIAFALRDHGGGDRAFQLLERVGLGHRSTSPLDQLSGGERQRIALARAFAHEPAILLMDEPFASLDDQKRAAMRELLRSLLDETRTTLVLVTHSGEDAIDLAARVLVLDGGRPVVSDTLERVLANPRHVAAVRSLGLGHVIDGSTTGGTTIETAFGRLYVDTPVVPGQMRLLVRAGQPRLVQAGEGVDAKISAIELRPPTMSDRVRRFAIVRVGGHTLRVEADDLTLEVGQSVAVRIEGTCKPLDG